MVSNDQSSVYILKWVDIESDLVNHCLIYERFYRPDVAPVKKTSVNVTQCSNTDILAYSNI